METSLKLEFDYKQEGDLAIAQGLEEATKRPELIEIAKILQQTGTKAPAIAKAAESVEIDPRLTRFNEDYESSGNPKLKATPWAEIQTRLLSNGGLQLTRALEMEQDGVLFGIDKQGNPLFADRGDEPVMKGMNYKNTRDRVLYKHDRNDISGKMLKDKSGQPVTTGYEMFGYVGDYEKSEEINQYEAHTGKKFVQNSREWRSSWLESGEAPSWPRSVNSFPSNRSSVVDVDYPRAESADRGVRRLLRVEKAA